MPEPEPQPDPDIFDLSDLIKTAELSHLHKYSQCEAESNLKQSNKIEDKLNQKIAQIISET